MFTIVRMFTWSRMHASCTVVCTGRIVGKWLQVRMVVALWTGCGRALCMVPVVLVACMRFVIVIFLFFLVIIMIIGVSRECPWYD